MFCPGTVCPDPSGADAPICAQLPERLKENAAVVRRDLQKQGNLGLAKKPPAAQEMRDCCLEAWGLDG